MNKAIFINKDGTLIRDVPFNVNPKLITLNSNLIEGLKLFQQHGYFLIMVTNQAGLAYGYFKEQALLTSIFRVEELLKFNGIFLDGFMNCPHHPEGKVKKYTLDCECRNPKPGLLINAAKKFNIDLKKSWVISDILNDIEAGNRAGCNTILIGNGVETEWFINDFRKPTKIALDVNGAADLIIESENVQKAI